MTNHIRRREFITLLGSAAAAWPLAAHAQQRTMPVIGFLGTGEPDNYRDNLSAFHRGLAETGYVEGRNVAVAYGWAADRLDRLPILAEDLVRRQVKAIAAISTQAAIAAGGATKSIPIAFAIGADPVQIGLVSSLNRPGGNITGIYSQLTGTAAKRLELLHELLPAATTIGFLVDPTDTRFGDIQMKETLGAAGVRGVRLLIVKASSPSEFEAAFATLTQQQASGLVVASDPLFSHYLDRLVALEAHHRIPTIYADRKY